MKTVLVILDKDNGSVLVADNTKDLITMLSDYTAIPVADSLWDSLIADLTDDLYAEMDGIAVHEIDVNQI